MSLSHVQLLCTVFVNVFVRSVLTILVKILPYRPPARLIRAKENLESHGIL